jgi:polysaccharide biosynthesis transport protein
MPDHESLPQSVQRYARVLRRQWWVAVLVTVVTIGAAVAYLVRAQPVYSANMKVVVGQGNTLFSPNLSVNVQSYTQTVTDLLQSQVVAQQTIAQLGLQTTPASLLSHLAVTTRADTAVIGVAFNDTNRQRAVTVLRTLGSIFTSMVNNVLDKSSAGGQAASQPVSVVVFDPAHGDPGRVSPRMARTLAIAGVLGLIAGLLLAFLRDGLSGRIRNEEEAESAYGAHVIGALPRGALGLPTGQAAGLPPKMAARLGESFQMLTARLRYSTDLPHGVILVAGARPEDGKSTVSAHIAAVLAASGNDVIAVEADLHRPALHRLLGVAPGLEGLRDIVSGDGVRELSSVLVPVQADSVHVAPRPSLAGALAAAGAGATNGSGAALPPEEEVDETGLLGQEGRLRLLCAGVAPGSALNILSLGNSAPLVAQLRSLCDYVVIDTPPLLLSGDAYPLVQVADAVVVVCRERATLQEEAVRTRRILKSLGVKDFSLVISESATAAASDYYGYAQGY